MKITSVVYWALLAALVASACLNPSEREGACTQCQPVEVLIKGVCYAKLRGCLVQEAGLVCAACQNGYVLSKNTCIREAVFLGLNGTDIPPVTLNDDVLSPEDLRDKLAELYGVPLSKGHQYLAQKHPELRDADIKKVETLNMRTGNIVSIVYTLANSSIDVAYIVRVNLLDQVSQIATGPPMAVPTDPVAADKAIRSAQASKLTGYAVYEVKVSADGQTYTFDYISAENLVKRIKLNKADLANPQTLALKLVVTDLTISDIAAEKIVERYQYLQNLSVSKVETHANNLYIVYFGNSYSVSVQFLGDRFAINQPISINAETNPPPIDQPPPIAGGYTTFTNLQDSRYLSALAFSVQTFPELIGARITGVSSQVVAGTNFLIKLQTNTGNKFEIYVYHNLMNQNRITEAYRNSKNVYLQNYNYNQDSIFIEKYQVVRKQTNVANIPPIASVTRQILGDVLYYKVIYNPRQFIEFTFNTASQQVKLVSYTVDGENILDIITPDLIQQATTRSSAILLEFLIQGRPELAGGKVSKFVSNPPNYELTVTSSTGTYIAQIEDLLGKIRVASFRKLSQKTCYEIPVEQRLGNGKIRGIDEFLMEQFNLNGYLLQLVQENVQKDSSVLRFLYTNDRYMQIVITLQLQGQSARLLKAYLMNYGYGILEPNQPQYSKILSYLNKIDLTGSRIPFYTEYNTTHYRAFYNDGKQTLEIVIDDKTGAGRLVRIQSNNKYLVPTGFNITTLIIPSVGNTPAPAAELAKVDKILALGKSKFNKYLGDAVVVFADKANNQFNVMFSSPSYGYIRAKVLELSSGTLVMDRIYITEWSDEDFSSCRKFSSEGKCLSCSAQEIQYQGQCFAQMPGCLIQAGELCVKCELDYIRSDYKCQKDCSNFFSDSQA